MYIASNSFVATLYNGTAHGLIEKCYYNLAVLLLFIIVYWCLLLFMLHKCRIYHVVY